MTEKLYYKDAYLAEFTATVLACETAENIRFAYCPTPRHTHGRCLIYRRYDT